MRRRGGGRLLTVVGAGALLAGLLSACGPTPDPAPPPVTTTVGRLPCTGAIGVTLLTHDDVDLGNRTHEITRTYRLAAIDLNRRRTLVYADSFYVPGGVEVVSGPLSVSGRTEYFFVDFQNVVLNPGQTREVSVTFTIQYLTFSGFLDSGPHSVVMGVPPGDPWCA